MVTTMNRDKLAPWEPTAGHWRVDPDGSHASFDARMAGYVVRGTLPLAGSAVIAEPVECSSARLSARTSAVSTGTPALDRLLTGPRFLDSRAYPEITFTCGMLAWVPAGWRAVGHLQVRGREYELACQLDLHEGEGPGSEQPRLIITSRWVIDSRWVTRRPLPGLSRRVVMACRFVLEPGTLPGDGDAASVTSIARHGLRLVNRP